MWVGGRVCVFEWASRVVSGREIADSFSYFQEGLLVLEMGDRKKPSWETDYIFSQIEI